MAKTTINHTKPEITGDANFEEIRINFENLTCKMGVDFDGGKRNGIIGVLATYNSLPAGEKPTALKFIKMLIVGAFNSALGTSYTWDQVPNSIFTPTVEE